MTVSMKIEGWEDLVRTIALIRDNISPQIALKGVRAAVGLLRKRTRGLLPVKKQDTTFRNPRHGQPRFQLRRAFRSRAFPLRHSPMVMGKVGVNVGLKSADPRRSHVAMISGTIKQDSFARVRKTKPHYKNLGRTGAIRPNHIVSQTATFSATPMLNSMIATCNAEFMKQVAAIQRGVG